jgi:hypothetical protein
MNFASIPFLRSAIASVLIAVVITTLTGCSAEDTANRQRSISDVHQGMIERREARQEARDERFRASRESWMN